VGLGKCAINDSNNTANYGRLGNYQIDLGDIGIAILSTLSTELDITCENSEIVLDFGPCVGMNVILNNYIVKIFENSRKNYLFTF
jgi:hypothetical protein